MAATEEPVVRDMDLVRWTGTEVEPTGMRGMDTTDIAMKVTASNQEALEAIPSTRWQSAEWATPRAPATRRSTSATTA